jgi:RsiW-degrading membrane proteinase PrsW (M82 family)
MQLTPPQAFLRLISTGSKANAKAQSQVQSADARPWFLLRDRQTIGRDPRCEIFLDGEEFPTVSRQHVRVEPLAENLTLWQVTDLSSVNGTYLNGDRLWGCRRLFQGDRLQLGQEGPMFQFEYQAPTEPSLGPGLGRSAKLDASIEEFGEPTLAASRVDPLVEPPWDSSHDLGDAVIDTPFTYDPHPYAHAAKGVTATQLFPILGTATELRQKAFLVPGAITVLLVVSLFLSVGQPGVFNQLLAFYLSAAGYFFIYQLCGKAKPWWVIIGTGAAMFALLSSPVLPGFLWFFREVLPGQLPEPGDRLPLISVFGRMFVGAGLMEELLKALPVLGCGLIGLALRSPLGNKIGIQEPLDGILLGAASAVGFTLLETLGQYVPDMTQSLAGRGTDMAELAGLQLLIPRVLGSVAGHMAYSGYFGYFIGLSVLQPRQRLSILTTGYLTASMLHALWNVMGNYSAAALAAVGVLSYACLVAAILKARALSPTRSANFATRLVDTPPDRL